MYETQAPMKTEKKEKQEKKLYKRYLLINKISPEPGLSSLVRIRGQQWRLIIPDLVYVLNNDEGLTHRLPVVDENWDLLLNGVHL